MAENYIQVNVNVSEEDARDLDQMMTDDGYDNRSAFFRRLIRQEKARRVSQPNPAISIESAEKAYQK